MTSEKSSNIKSHSYLIGFLMLAGILSTILACTVWFIKEPFVLSIARYISHAGILTSAIAAILLFTSGTKLTQQKNKIIISISTFILLLTFSIQSKPIIDTGICQANLRNINIAIRDIIHTFPSQTWCSDLSKLTANNTEKYGKNFNDNFICPSSQDKKCSFTLNSDFSISSPPDTILLFESKDGWNQTASTDQAVFSNHSGKCSVLLANGQIKLITKEQLQ